MVKLVFVFKVFLLFFFIVLTINSRERLHALVWVLAVSLGFYGFWGGARSIATGGLYRIGGPPNSYISDNNDLALAIVMIIPLLFYLYRNSEVIWVRFGIAFVGLLSCFAVLTTFSRGGLVGFSAMLLVLIWKSSNRRFLPLALAFGVAFAAFQFMPAHWHDRMRTIETYEEDSSAQARLEMWAFGWRVAINNPFLGGGYEVFSNPIAYDKYDPELVLSSPHSIIFQVLGEHGFVGLILYLMLWGSAWRTASSVRSKTKRNSAMTWAHDLAGMSQASMVGYFIGGLFLSKAYFDILIVIFALPSVLSVIVNKGSLKLKMPM